MEKIENDQNRKQMRRLYKVIGLLLLSLFLATGVFVYANSTADEHQAIVYKGETYICADLIAKSMKLSLSPYNDKDKAFSITGPGINISGEEHRRDVKICGVIVTFSFPVIKANGQFYIAKSDYDNSISPILSPGKNPALKPLHRIIIDAGHGAHDSGTQNKTLGLQEKNITLQVSNLLAESLGAQGYEVILTRNQDKFLTLEERPDIANKLDADLFISLHCNAAANATVKGIEVFAFPSQGHPPSNRDTIQPTDKQYYNGNQNNAWSMVLAYYIQRQLVTETKSPDRGVKRQRFIVLRDAKCPAVLVELGFLSNATEGALLSDSQYQKSLVKALSEGIFYYWKTYEKTHPQQQTKPVIAQPPPDPNAPPATPDTPARPLKF